MRVEVEVAGELPLTATAEQELFRVAQEALSNVARHSAATAVRVWVGVERQSVALRITDNGHGFDLAAQAQGARGGTSGVGLDSMRERVEALGGLLLVSSSPAGTRLEARVPAAEGSAATRGELAAPDASVASDAPGLTIAPVNAEGTVR
jgi:signal transduction histidine kinase